MWSQTAFEGRILTLSINCGDNYPNVAPTVTFKSKVAMNCVGSKGEVCIHLVWLLLRVHQTRFSRFFSLLQQYTSHSPILSLLTSFPSIPIPYRLSCPSLLTGAPSTPSKPSLRLFFKRWPPLPTAPPSNPRREPTTKLLIFSSQ